MREERTPETPAYYRHQHGFCEPCGLFFTWLPRQGWTLALARCPKCQRPPVGACGASLNLVTVKRRADQVLAVGSPTFVQEVASCTA